VKAAAQPESMASNIGEIQHRRKRGNGEEMAENLALNGLANHQSAKLKLKKCGIKPCNVSMAKEAKKKRNIRK
jgi:hypothetical protein